MSLGVYLFQILGLFLSMVAVNTLEDPHNEYRAIFAVDKLNEG